VNLFTVANRQATRAAITPYRYTTGNSALKNNDTDNGIIYLPLWFHHNQNIMLKIECTYARVYLQLMINGTWAFVPLDKQGKIHTSHPLPNLAFDWFDRVDSETLILGRQYISNFLGTAKHVSASLCKLPCPSSLLKDLDPSHPDHLVWHASYKEEYDGLLGFDTFEELTLAEYWKLAKAHGHAIPSMCGLVAKKDENGNPIRAKSRIVVLGNKNPHQWSKGDFFVPVTNQSAVRLLVSLTIEHNKVSQQGDCKNAFCNPVLPEDEVVIVHPLADVHSPNQTQSGDYGRPYMFYVDHLNTGMICSNTS
jgi:hypothetical protein